MHKLTIYIMFYTILLLLLINVRNPVKCTTEMEILNRILNESSYDKLTRPPGDRRPEDPTNIEINTYLRSIDDIDERKRTSVIQFTLRMSWNDDRLRYDDDSGGVEYVSVPYNTINSMWHPDIFIVNAQQTQIHKTIYHDAYYRIYPTGKVMTSKRITVKISNFYYYVYFPFDRHLLTLEIESFAYSMSDLVFSWRINEPIQAHVKNLDSEQFTLTATRTKSIQAQLSTGNYSRVAAEMLLKRVSSFYIYHYFLPSIALVCLSWLVIIFDDCFNALSRRIWILCCLAAQAMLVYMSFDVIPIASHQIAMDYWTGLGLGMLLVELLFVLCVDGNTETTEGKKTVPCNIPWPQFCPEFIKISPLRISVAFGKIFIPAVYILAVAIFFLKNATQ